jgi:hypothetical protein
MMASLKREIGSALEGGPLKKAKADRDKAGIAESNTNSTNGHEKRKQILLNAFDMSTVGHLSPGQWKVSSSFNPKSMSSSC